jgi:type III restriction enzyme
MQHYRETPLAEDDYEVRVTHGFALLRPQPFSVPNGQAAHNFRQAVRPLSDTKRHVFGGFRKCCYPLQRFDSDPERRFAISSMTICRSIDG